MGYSTDFSGQFDLDHPLCEGTCNYLRKFAETRRMKRNAAEAAKLADPAREAVGLPIGKDGEYFVGSEGFMGQDQDSSIVEYNYPPSTQPGLWCQWVPNEDGTAIEWDGGEKFYEYVEWLEYIISNFLDPWGYKLNGQVEWQGEDMGDRGVIRVKDNVVDIGYFSVEFG